MSQQEARTIAVLARQRTLLNAGVTCQSTTNNGATSLAQKEKQ
jgi:hypothetical protein